MYVERQKYLRSVRWAWVSLVALFASSLAFSANEAPQACTYQGRFMNGASPMTGSVDLKFEIYDPSGSCLLYQEVDLGNNLTTSTGNVAIPIGQGTRGPQD